MSDHAADNARQPMGGAGDKNGQSESRSHTEQGGEAQEPRPQGVERRGPDRRKNDTGSPTGLERRRGPGRRLSDFIKAAEEGEMTQEQFLFLMAIDAFKKANGKVYPSWTDVLEVIRLLGYRKTAASQIKLRNAEDWTEAPDAEADVRRKKDGQRRAA